VFSSNPPQITFSVTSMCQPFYWWHVNEFSVVSSFVLSKSIIYFSQQFRLKRYLCNCLALACVAQAFNLLVQYIVSLCTRTIWHIWFLLIFGVNIVIGNKKLIWMIFQTNERKCFFILLSEIKWMSELSSFRYLKIKYTWAIFCPKVLNHLWQLQWQYDSLCL